MARFDLPRKPKVDPDEYPDWANNTNERKTYDAVKSRIEEIEQLIKTSKAPLSASERKIAKSVICKSLGLSPSYIAKHDELNEHVETHQRRLNRLSEGLKEVKAQQQSNAKKPEAMNKPDLVGEVKKLRKQMAERSSELYVEQLQWLLENGLAESQVIAKNRVKAHQDQILALQSHNSKLNSAVQILKEEMIAVMRASKSHSPSVISLLKSTDDPDSVVQIMKTSSKRGK